MSCTLLRGTYRPKGEFRFSACPRPPWRLQGTRSSAGEALLPSGRGRLFGYISPGPGWNWGLQRCMSSGPQRIRSSVEDRPGAVGLRQQCGGPKAPAELARSKRFAPSKAPCGHGGTPSTAPGIGGTRSTASLGPGGTGPSIESLPSGRGGTRPLRGPWVWSELARPVPSTGETGCAPWFLLASHRGSFER